MPCSVRARRWSNSRVVPGKPQRSYATCLAFPVVHLPASGAPGRCLREPTSIAGRHGRGNGRCTGASDTDRRGFATAAIAHAAGY